MSSDAPFRRARYRHTQRAGLLQFLLAGAIVLILVVGVLAGALRDPLALAVLIPVLAVLAIVLVLFSSLTVEVDGEALRIAFGPGLVRHAWPLDRVRSWRAVRNPWWYGWGIHLTPGGWLYNVAGSEAVEIVLADGRRRRIGTDDPSGLVAALEAARRP
jgi:hypothetical protein